MNAIVVYKSRYGSTRGIAEFIAETLREHGVQAEARTPGSMTPPLSGVPCIWSTG
jgi:menaquinone-dependent protoporphyrinogen oxidase